MDLKPIEKLRPFQKFCITIGELPVSYLESMTYLEMVMWLINFLQEKVIPAVNNNAEAVEELQTLFTQLHDYVENYFDNLDVQDEINNKLDEMVEDGTLESLLRAYYLHSIISYKTVSDMVNDSTLIANITCKTLGYHTINDGGQALYFTRARTENDVEDNGSIIFIGDDLVAELIVDNDINVKQFGAYGDNDHDDTTAIQTAINFLSTLNITNYASKNFKYLNMNSGIYKVNTQIRLSPLVQIKTDNKATILSSVTDTSTLWLYPTADELDAISDDINTYLDCYNDNYINGLKIECDLNSNSNIALEIGTRTQISTRYKICMTSISNLLIDNFATGIKINSNNFYCNTFNRLQIRSKTNIEYGNGSPHNSGERITFNDCQFGATPTNIIFKFSAGGGSFNFNNCSFDYANCCFYDSDNYGYKHVNCSNCWFEGLNRDITNVNDNNGIFGIIYGNFIYSKFNITDSRIAMSNRFNLFRIKDVSPNNSYYRLKLINIVLAPYADLYESDPTYRYISENVNVEKLINVESTQSTRTKFISNDLNVIPDGDFESAEIGDISIPNNTNIGNLNLFYKVGISNDAEIVRNTVDNKKSLKLVATAQNPSVQFYTKMFNVTPGDQLKISAWCYGFYALRAQCIYYTDDDVELGRDESSVYNNPHDTPLENYYFVYPKIVTVPKGASKVKLYFVFFNTGTPVNVPIGTNCLIGELMCEKS